MFCTNCGKSIADSAKVCPACGVAVTPDVPTEVIPNYLAWAIVVTLLCCLPTGIVSIVYSTQVNSKLAAGDIEGARGASKSAKTWIRVSVVVGLLVSILYAVGTFYSTP